MNCKLRGQTPVPPAFLSSRAISIALCCSIEPSDYLALDYLAFDQKNRGRETSIKNHLTSRKEHLENEESAREKGGRGRGCMSMCVCVHVYVYRKPGGVESVARQLCDQKIHG